MTTNISATGFVVSLSASETTKGVPVLLTAFPKDSDPFDIPDVDIADAEVGVNGDLITWATYNPIDISLSVIPATKDHEFLMLLHNMNRPEAGKLISKDSITISRALPNGEILTLSEGVLISGPPASAIDSSGKLKTPTYKFRFSQMRRTPAVLELTRGLF